MVAVKNLEQAALALRDDFKDKNGKTIVRHILTSVGTQPFQSSPFSLQGSGVADHVGEVTIELGEAKDRSVTSDEFVAAWRKLGGNFPGDGAGGVLAVCGE